MVNKGTKTITTSRLILRQFRYEDAVGMYKNWASDPEVVKFLTWPAHKDVELTKILLSDWIERYTDSAYYNWVIYHKEDGEIIGNISVVHLDEKIEAAEIGYCMGKAWWGQAIMPEALKAVIAYLFSEVNLNRIAACYDSNNPKSGRVMEKAGMKLEGILRSAGINNQGVCNKVWYSIIRDEYKTEIN